MSEVIFYTSDEVGAPTLSNALGSLTAILDACLVNGFNARTITINVTAGVATATASAHGYRVGRKVLIAGATAGALNGVKKILSVGANTFTFEASGVADGAVSGAITAKRAPLGWDIRFTGTNKRVYGRTEPGRNDDVLMAEHNGEYAQASIIAAASAASLTDFTESFTTHGANGRLYAPSANSASPHPWCLIGDGRIFYFIAPTIAEPNFNTPRALLAFGSPVELLVDDAWCSLVTGQSTVGGSNSAQFGVVTLMAGPIGGTAASIRRGSTGAVGRVSVGLAPPMSAQWLLHASFPALESAPQGLFPVGYPTLGRSDTEPLRFIMPGLAHTTYTLSGVSQNQHYREFSTADYDIPFDLFAAAYGNGAGSMLFNATGPWR